MSCESTLSRLSSPLLSITTLLQQKCGQPWIPEESSRHSSLQEIRQQSGIQLNSGTSLDVCLQKNLQNIDPNRPMTKQTALQIYCADKLATDTSRTAWGENRQHRRESMTNNGKRLDWRCKSDQIVVVSSSSSKLLARVYTKPGLRASSCTHSKRLRPMVSRYAHGTRLVFPQGLHKLTRHPRVYRDSGVDSGGASKHF